MSWKDYFYFQKGDKTAILLLLILIAVSGGVYILTRPEKAEEKTEQLSPSSRSLSDSIQSKGVKSSTSSAYPYQEKLKAGQTIELNSADTTALKKIPGIGTAYSNRIVKYRALLGGFASIGQLKEVWGMDDGLYARIIPYITIVPKTEKIRINHTDFKGLNRHPYIDYKQAKVIVDIRERKGRIESVNRLSLLEEFTEDDIKRLTPYLSFD